MSTKVAKANKALKKDKQVDHSVQVYDIIHKVKDTHQQADKKLEEISLMCTGKDLKG